MDMRIERDIDDCRQKKNHDLMKVTVLLLQRLDSWRPPGQTRRTDRKTGLTLVRQK